MGTIKGRNGGTLSPWQKGQTGNPHGRKKGLQYWVRELQTKKKFEIKLTMTDEDGEETIVTRSLELGEAAAKMAATQLWLKAVQGDMEALRELARIEQAHEERSIRNEEDHTPQKSVSIPIEIIDPKSDEALSLDIGGSDDAAD